MSEPIERVVKEKVIIDGKEFNVTCDTMDIHNLIASESFKNVDLNTGVRILHKIVDKCGIGWKKRRAKRPPTQFNYFMQSCVQNPEMVGTEFNSKGKFKKCIGIWKEGKIYRDNQIKYRNNPLYKK